MGNYDSRLSQMPSWRESVCVEVELDFTPADHAGYRDPSSVVAASYEAGGQTITCRLPNGT